MGHTRERYQSWLLAGWLALALTALSAGPAQAQSPAPKVLDLIARQGQVVLGHVRDAPPFASAPATGTPTGYAVDWCNVIVEHLRLVLKKPDLPVSHVEVPQDQMLRVVGSGGVHLMCAAVSDTPERRQSLRFSAPIFFSQVKLLVPARSTAQAVADLKGRTVSVLGRTSAEKAVQDHSVAHSLELKLSRVISADAALSQVILGQASAWARDEVLLLGIRARQPRPSDWRLLPQALSSEPIAIAFAADPDLQRVVDQAMALAVRSGAAEQMHRRWFQLANPLTLEGLNLPISPELQRAWQMFKP
jgi:glutamate/aspartate transport system substrate-binding protein